MQKCVYVLGTPVVTGKLVDMSYRVSPITEDNANSLQDLVEGSHEYVQLTNLLFNDAPVYDSVMTALVKAGEIYNTSNEYNRVGLLNDRKLQFNQMYM